MNKQQFNNLITVITFNGLVSLLLCLLYKYITFSFNMDSLIGWIDEYTKQCTKNIFVIFILLMVTVKLQLRLIEKLETSRPWILTLSKYAYILLLSGIMSIITSYYMVYFQLLKEPTATLEWIEGSTRIFFAGAIFLFFIYLFVFFLIGNIYISSIITAIVIFVLGFVHYNKLNLRVEPLYPADFSQITQMRDVIPMVKEYLSLQKAILIVVVVGIMLFFVRYLPKAKISFRVRVILLALTAGMIYAYTFFPTSFMKNFVQKVGNVSIVKWDQLENYKNNGFVFGFISNIQNDAFEEPDGYSKKNVLDTAKKYIKINTSQTSAKGEVKKPNIVYIMSEAFWDPTKLKNVQFSEDPMPNLRKLMDQYSSGYNLSPSFGGATANVEFEALTGFSNYFLKVGSIPYQDIIDRKNFIPTIVSDLEGQGYQSLAIHPYNKIFYKRNRVYDVFGFDQFLDMSTMKHQDMSGPYISDESLSKEVIDELKKEEKPMFVHAVTVQNHFPYTPNRYEQNQIDVSGLSPEYNELLEVYSEGIRQADEALQLLVDQLEQLDEPTIVVFWGDHLPILGQDLAIYKETKYASKKANKFLYEKKYAETPLLIYSNYSIEKQELNTLSPAFYGPTVYEMAGLKKPPFYNLLDLVKEEIPGLKVSVQIDGNQKFITKDFTNKQKQLLKDYQLLEYDLLVGKQYSKDLLFK
ncbi:LTA synthase family protein [Neobacillus sp. WH10]|uniref:LTA synthase family protein n=1 Tax=Neobacillus sp. WH10 TaxID=3047873 RepID=UPI0024C1B85B|nr:LTA synthase family protein [Neobacillus sp. WH10]WHY76928.1 LTA synthase family protein [Neobacillus sp. WH10]